MPPADPAEAAAPWPWERIEADPDVSALPREARKQLARNWGEALIAHARATHGKSDQEMVGFMAGVGARVQEIHDDIDKPTVGERVRGSGRAVQHALASAGNAILQAPGVLASLDRIPNEPHLPAELRGQKTPLASVGERVVEETVELQDTIDRTYAPDPAFAGTFNHAVASGAGSLAAIAATGAAGRVLGLGPAAATFLAGGVGSAMEASGQYHDALRHGADEETALQAWAAGAAIGTSEALPLARVFGKLDKVSGGAFRRAVKNAATGGAQEAAQEFLQTAAGNAAARALYDEDRELLEGTGHATGAGGLLGALLHVGAGARRAPAAQPVSTDAPKGAGMTIELGQPPAPAPVQAAASTPAPVDAGVDADAALARPARVPSSGNGGGVNVVRPTNSQAQLPGGNPFSPPADQAATSDPSLPGGSGLRDPAGVDPGTMPDGRPAQALTVTAMTQLAKALELDVKVNPAMRSAYGRAVYRRNGQEVRDVELMQGLMRDESLAEEVLAHEIGHHIDKSVPTSGHGKQMKGKLMPLIDPSIVFGTGNKPAELTARIQMEAADLSAEWRGPFDPADQYRNNSSELYADFLSSLLNSPARTRDNYPMLTQAFYAGLDDKPAARDAYYALHDMVKDGQVDGHAQERLLEGFREGHERMVDFSRADKAGRKQRAVQAARTARRHLLSRYEWIARREGFRDRSRRGDTFTDQLEQNEGFAMAERALFDDDMRRNVFEPLEQANVSHEQLSAYLFHQRVIQERTATGSWVEANPDEATDALLFLQSELLPGAPRLREIAEAARGNGKETMKAAAAIVHAIDTHSAGQNRLRERAESLLWEDSVPEDMRGLLTAFNVRGMMPNPEGFTPDSSARALLKMREEAGPADWDALELAASHYHQVLGKRVRQAYEEGLIAPDVWAERIEPNLGNYVPYQVVEYLKPDVSAAIRSQVGTTKAVQDPLVATNLYTYALLGWIQRQRAAKTTARAAEAFGIPYNDLGAVSRQNPIDIDRLAKQNPDRGYLNVWVDGRRHVYEFYEPEIAQAATHFEELDFVTRMAGKWGGLFGQLFTTYSPGFLAYTNTMRDLRTGFERLGTSYLGNIPGGFRVAWNYAKAATGKAAMSDEVRTLVEERILPPPAASIGHQLLRDDALPHMIESSTAAYQMLKGRKSVVNPSGQFRAPEVVLGLKQMADNVFVFAGAISEALTKATASHALAKKGFKPADRVKLARLMGIPNPGVGGMSVKQANAFLLFYRVAAQGWRADRTFLVNPKTRGGYAMRHAITSLMPKLLIASAATGTLAAALRELGFEPGDDLEEFYQRLSGYKLEHGDVIPIAWWTPDGFEPVWGHSHDEIGDDWQAVGFRFPVSELGRIFGTGTWNALKQNSEKLRDPESVSTWARWLFTQMPGVNPAIDLFSKNYQVANNVNPIDTYRRRPIIDYHTWEAGGWDRYQALGLWNMSQVTGAFWHWDTAVDTSTLTDGQKLARKLPIIKNLITVDNFKAGRERAVADAEESRINSRAVLALGDNTAARRLYTAGNRLERVGSDRTPTEQLRYEVFKEWNRKYWEGTNDSPGLRDPLRAAIAAGDNQERDRIAEIIQAASEPYWEAWRHAR